MGRKGPGGETGGRGGRGRRDGEGRGILTSPTGASALAHSFSTGQPLGPIFLPLWGSGVEGGGRPRGADVDVAVEKALLPHALQLWSVFVILEASEREPRVSICVSGNGGGCCKLTTQHVEKSFSGLVWGRQRWGARHASPSFSHP